jgi:hypothetical protein
LAFLAALLVAWSGLVFAQVPAVPPSQAAFRVAIQKFHETAQAEKNDTRFGELERLRAAAFAKALGPELSFAGWMLELKGIEPTRAVVISCVSSIRRWPMFVFPGRLSGTEAPAASPARQPFLPPPGCTRSCSA